MNFFSESYFGSNICTLNKSIAYYLQSAPDAEHGDETVLVTEPQTQQPQRHRRISSCILMILAMTVLGLGIMTGVSLYSSYARQRMHRFHGFCGVPYDSRTIDNQDMIYMNNIFRAEKL